MTDATQRDSNQNPSDYLAAERTFLAWIRTGLALMGFGFVVARFGLFLQELQLIPAGLRPHQPVLSVWFGTALIIAGVFVNVSSSVHHVRFIRNLQRGRTDFNRPSSTAIALALLVAAIGLAMATYLVLFRNPQQANLEIPEKPMTANADNGIIRKPSSHSMDETVERLKGILLSKGVTLFALVDHSGEAQKAGMKMPPTKLLIFGSPKAGTPLMLASPSAAIDLPLKILVAEDASGKVWLSYNSPEYLKQRHNLPEELLPNIAVAETLVAKAGE
ncbi:MAG: DUF302 domain-containing protein [Candidatus Acidiferrales bacterium]